MKISRCIFFFIANILACFSAWAFFEVFFAVTFFVLRLLEVSFDFFSEDFLFDVFFLILVTAFFLPAVFAEALVLTGEDFTLFFVLDVLTAAAFFMGLFLSFAPFFDASETAFTERLDLAF